MKLADLYRQAFAGIPNSDSAEGQRVGRGRAVTMARRHAEAGECADSECEGCEARLPGAQAAGWLTGP